MCCFVFFFNDTATTEFYTLSLHDALPISVIPLAHVAEFLFTCMREHRQVWRDAQFGDPVLDHRTVRDRKSTRLNSSHGYISYAVFCLKKKKKTDITRITTHRSTTRATSLI